MIEIIYSKIEDIYHYLYSKFSTNMQNKLLNFGENRAISNTVVFIKI